MAALKTYLKLLKYFWKFLPFELQKNAHLFQTFGVECRGLYGFKLSLYTSGIM
jgi:hypothetical protein